jgi:hypothetical protein
MERPILIKREAQDVRAPVSGPVVDLGGRDGGGKSGWARFRVFEAGAVHASKEHGTARRISELYPIDVETRYWTHGRETGIF